MKTNTTKKEKGLISRIEVLNASNQITAYFTSGRSNSFNFPQSYSISDETNITFHKDRLANWCIGQNIETLTDFFKEMFGSKVVDEKIDDGSSDQCNYIIKRTLDINDIYIDLYYLNSDEIVSYVSFSY